jgi:hypothetical protein
VTFHTQTAVHVRVCVKVDLYTCVRKHVLACASAQHLSPIVCTQKEDGGCQVQGRDRGPV